MLDIKISLHTPVNNNKKYKNECLSEYSALRLPQILTNSTQLNKQDQETRAGIRFLNLSGGCHICTRGDRTIPSALVIMLQTVYNSFLD